MPAAIDITGERYGRLVAICKTHTRDYPSGQSRAVWLFKCDCGNEVQKTAFDVRRSDTKSCGCARFGRQAANRIAHGEASFNGLFSHYVRSAKYRGYEWALSKDQFRSITVQCCSYCGSKPSQSHLTHKSAYGEYIYTGVDRVDNSRGYEIDNVVPCCGTCNRAKGAMSSEEFLEWVDRVYVHRARGKVVA
jgi:5-methylcytosine-specific restriction endonuclease McrA